MYADLGGVCLYGLAQRLCLWGYTRSSPNVRTEGITRTSCNIRIGYNIRSSYICSYVQVLAIVYEYMEIL